MLGVPSALEQGALAIGVTAVHHTGTNVTQEHLASTHFIIQILPSFDNHILWSLDTNVNTAATKHQVDNHLSPSTTQILNKCTLDHNTYHAVIVLDADFAHFSAKQRVKVLYKLANFISHSVYDISLVPRKSEAVSRLMDQKVLYAGPGTASITSKNTGIELTWILGCGDFIQQLSDFVQVIEHNIQTNRISSELNHDIIGWQVMETQPPEQIRKLRRRRRQVMRTPMATPTVYSSLPSSVQTDDHQPLLTESASQLLVTTSVSNEIGFHSSLSPEYSLDEVMSSIATDPELTTSVRSTDSQLSITPTRTVAIEATSIPTVQSFSNLGSIDTLSPSLSQDLEPSYSLIKDTHSSTDSISITDDMLLSSVSSYVLTMQTGSLTEVPLTTSGISFILSSSMSSSMTYIPTMTSSTEMYLEPSTVFQTDSDVMPTTDTLPNVLPSLTNSEASSDLSLDVSVWPSVVSPSETLMQTSFESPTFSPREETLMPSTHPNVTANQLPSSSGLLGMTSQLQSEYVKTSSVFTTPGMSKGSVIPSDVYSDSNDVSDVLVQTRQMTVLPTVTCSSFILVEMTTTLPDMFTSSQFSQFSSRWDSYSSQTLENELSLSEITEPPSVSETEYPAEQSVFRSSMSQVLEPSQIPFPISSSQFVETSQISRSLAHSEFSSFVKDGEISTLISQTESEWISPSSGFGELFSSQDITIATASSVEMTPHWLYSSALYTGKSQPAFIESSLILPMPSFTYSTPILPSDMIIQSPSDITNVVSSTAQLMSWEFSSHMLVPNKTLVGPPRTTVVPFLTPDISSSRWEDIYASAGFEMSEELFTKASESQRSRSVTPAVSEQLVTSTQTVLVIGTTPSVMVTKDTVTNPVTVTSEIGLDTQTSTPQSSNYPSRSTPSATDASTVQDKWKTTTGLYVGHMTCKELRIMGRHS